MKFIVAAILLAIAPLQSFSDDPSAQAKRAEGKKLYAQRENIANVEKAISILWQAVNEASSSDVKYDAFIDLARAQYFKGTRAADNNAKMAEFEKAYQIAQQAKGVNDSYAEAYYYYGISLARWAEAKGIIASLSRKQELIDHMEGTQQRDTREGKSGDTLDGYGSDRVLGRMFFKLPGFAGGSFDKSLKHLTRAWTSSKEMALNWVYYAETLLDGNAQQKAQGCQLLKDLLAKDPKTLNPDRVLETTEEFGDARALQAKSCRK